MQKKSPSDRDDQFLVSFADLVSLCKRSKKLILYAAFAFACLGACYALTRPVRYEAEGTFREKGVKSNFITSSANVMQILGNGPSAEAESEAASLMTSRRILKDVVEKLNLQGELYAASEKEGIPKKVGQNLLLTLTSLFGKPTTPVLPDRCCPLTIKNLIYTGEIPLTFTIHLQTDGSFKVLSKKDAYQGKLGESFQLERLTFSLNSSTPKEGYYVLHIDSLQNTVKELCKNLEVEPSKLDKGLLSIKCTHRDRQLASDIVNAAMASYQNYLKDYHAEVASDQLAYLSQRREQLTENLIDVMQKHADFLTQDITHSGFIESNKEIDYLSRSLQDYKNKLLENELEIKRLNSIEPVMDSDSIQESQGMSLEVATELYLKYSREWVNLEGLIRKNAFLIAQIEDPQFEITSLSVGLEDPVSLRMIEKASELVLHLRDENNQSAREQERIKDELHLQKTFLTLHLKQMVELLELQKDQIDKSKRICWRACLNNLQQEKALFQRHLDSIHAQMAFVPQKWASENLLAQAVETNQKIVEEIAKLVESKNIRINSM